MMALIFHLHLLDRHDMMHNYYQILYHLYVDNDKCILCRRCETMCNQVQKVGVLSGVNRGFSTEIGTFFETDLAKTECTFCGQCINVCPTGALLEKDNTDEAWGLLAQKEKPVMVQIAPAVSVGISEEFGLKPGTISTGKVVAALKALGFDYVLERTYFVVIYKLINI